jgi:tRNA pseudouridine38-40 synthase
MPANHFDNRPLLPGTRVACRVEYQGNAFHGWQAQVSHGHATVQETVEAALSAIGNTSIRIACAGRTDAGVHGFAQIIHFDDPVGRSPKAWVVGGNSQLPASVRLHWAVPVDTTFHARFSALWRRYRYIVSNTSIKSAHLAGLVTPCRRPLCADTMAQAAVVLLGEQDFSAFRAASCQSSTPFRCVTAIEVWRQGDFVVIDITANAFLHHMVRNIAGSLLVVGAGERSPAWFADVLASKDRTLAAETAPPDGLYLVEVGYPDRYTLPSVPPGPMMISGLS